MAANKETSIGIKLTADLRNYQSNLDKGSAHAKKFAGNVTNSIKSVTAEFGNLMRGDITALPRIFTAATNASSGFAKGLNGVKVALISTGIGAIIVTLGSAIAGLTHYFKGTEEGQIAFKKVMNNIKAYTEPVLQMFGKLGKALVELFKGNFGAAWEAASGAISGAGEAIKENKANVDELNQAEEAYIKKKRANLLANKMLEDQIAEARLKSEDEATYNAKQRQAFAAEAISKQKEYSKNLLEINALEYKIEKMKADFGDNDIATNDRLAELQGVQYEITAAQNKALKRSSETYQRITKEVEAQVALQNIINAQIAEAAKNSKFTTIETRKFEGPLNPDAPELDTSALDSMSDIMDANIEKVQQFKEELYQLHNTQQAVVDSVSGGFQLMGANIVSSLGLATTGFQGFLSGLLQTVTKLIAMMLSQSIANSIAGATASGAATGPASIIATPAFIATAVGGVLAAFAAIPKFAAGGIVPGMQYMGDKVIARVNSGEEIIRRDDPRHQLNMGGMSGNNNVTILQPSINFDGEKMHVMLKRVDNRINKRT